MSNKTKIKRAIGILFAVMIFPAFGMIIASIKGDPLMIGFLAGMIINAFLGGLGGVIALLAWLFGATE